MTTRHEEHTDTDTLADTAELYASGEGDDWVVYDPAGGVWCPDDEAAAEIAASADPESTAVRMCLAAPMRGTWFC